MDAISLSAVFKELKEHILGARITKISQPSELDLILGLRRGREDFNLYLSAHPRWARVHLTPSKHRNLPRAKPFCMLLRKYLVGGRIVGIENPGLERALNILVESYDEIGDRRKLSLIAEIMGKHSNVILLDSRDKRIYEGLKHVVGSWQIGSEGRKPRYISSYRQILPGEIYIPPPKQNKVDPMGLDKEGFLALLKEIARKSPNTKLKDISVDNLLGISPLMSKEIANLSHLDPSTTAGDLDPVDYEKLWMGLDEILGELRSEDFKPTIYISEKDPDEIIVSPLELSLFYSSHDYNRRYFPTMSEALDFFYSEKIKWDNFISTKGNLSRIISDALRRCKRKEKSLLKQSHESEDADRFRIMGELITANIFRLKTGQKEVELTNYYAPDGASIRVSLNPGITPAENAQRYFKKYNKAKRKGTLARTRLKETEEEIDYLEGIALALEGADSPEDIQEVRDELVQGGYIRGERRSKGTRSIQPKPRRFTLAGGWEVLVGRNNKENDLLSTKIASPADLWFHTKDIPSAHVILRNPNRLADFKDDIIAAAAMLAAYYSKARNSSNVPVDYTFCKYLKKPKGAKDGMVTYSHQKTLYVTPKIEELKELVNPLPT